jgi:peptide/nickel transport system ATP-binding protein
MKPVLEVRDLTKEYAGGGIFRRTLAFRALDAVSFAIARGEVLALVGESGSGKTTAARLVLRLTASTAGTILLDGEDVLRAEPRGASLRYRRAVQMVFQDPFASLNPTRRVRDHLRRPLRIHHPALTTAEVDARVASLLGSVGLDPPDEIAARYPHELSGGQRQRVAIARALAVDPRLVVADEPTSMLDVSIRVGILNLIVDLKQRKQLAFLYVTHDLASARYVADYMLVMYAGQIVEQGPAESVLQSALHPYTRLLLESVPDPASDKRERIEVRKGSASAAIDPAAGCRFADRCPLRIGICTEITPQLVLTQDGHSARCHVTAPSPASREEIHVQSTP